SCLHETWGLRTNAVTESLISPRHKCSTWNIASTVSLPKFPQRQIVPRETSCNRNHPLLDFRWRGLLGANHRGGKSERWGRKNDHSSQSFCMSRHRRSCYTACRLRFSSQRNGGHWPCERSFPQNPLSFADSQRTLR